MCILEIGFSADWASCQTGPKGSKTVTALRLLGNTVRGLGVKHFRRLHICALQPQILYAAPVWYTGERQKGLVHKLEVVQNQSLRLILAAFKTTPTRALQTEASIPPVKITLDQHLERAALRLNGLDLRHPILQRLPPAWRGGLPPFYPPPLALLTRPKTRLEMLALRSNPHFERIKPFADPPWRRGLGDLAHHFKSSLRPPGVDKEVAAEQHVQLARELENSQRHLVVYAASCEMDGKVGGGVMGFLGGEEEIFRQFWTWTGCSEVGW